MHQSVRPLSIQTTLLSWPPTITPPSQLSPIQATPVPSCIRLFSVTIHYFDGFRGKIRGGKKWMNRQHFDFQKRDTISFISNLSSFLFLALCLLQPISTFHLLIPYSSLTLCAVRILHILTFFFSNMFPPPTAPHFCLFSPPLLLFSLPPDLLYPPLCWPLQPLYTPLTCEPSLFWLSIALLLAAFFGNLIGPIEREEPGFKMSEVDPLQSASTYIYCTTTVPHPNTHTSL